MPTVTGNSTVNIITWSQTQQSVRYFDVYRRPDNVTADITTANIIAKVGAGSNHYVDPVDNAPYWYWIKAISWAGKSSAFSATIVGSPSDTLTGEPTGFPNRTSSVITWDNATRTLSISPAGTYFNYYIGGVKAEVTAAITVTVPNTSTLSYMYFDDAVGTLVSTSSFTDAQLGTLIRTKALVAAVYYNTAGSTTYYADERHGIIMPGIMHQYMHFTNGFQFYTGGAINTITADGSGASNDHAQFGIDAGYGYDEDIPHPCSEVLAATGCEIWYRSGANGDWVSTTNAGYSFLVSGTPLLQYNEWTGAVWQLSEVTNNQFALIHIFAVNQVTNQYVSILGQNDYSTLNAAREGAADEISNLSTSGLPDKEYAPLATVILQTSNAYGNDMQTRVRSYSSTEDYVDWRFQTLTPGTGPTDHGSLSGLSDDDHQQYLLLAGRGGQVIDDSLTISGAVTINNDLAVSSQVTAGVIQFDTAYVHPAHSEGALHWNADDGTLDIDMPGGDVHLQLGQEMFIRAKNDQSAAITNGQVVYICSATGSRPSVALADATNFAKTNALAMATEDVADGNNGFFTTMGLVRDLNTNGMGVGTPIYLDPSTPGGWTTTYTPATAGYTVALGYVIRDHLTEGVILFKSQLIPKLFGLSDVEHCAATTEGQFLRYDATEGIYRHQNLSLFETAAGTVTLEGNMVPTADVTRTLGTATERFDTIYGRTLQLGPAITKISGTADGTLHITGNIQPTAAGTYDIGKVGAEYQWMFAYYGDYSYLYPRVYVEFTAQASTPATPATGGMIRLFAKDTGGETKLCYIGTAGTTVTLGEGGGGASVALDNLDTVAINTSLVSDTNNTDDLGTTATRWKDGFVHALYVGSGSTTTKLSATAAGTINITGHLVATADDTYNLGSQTNRFSTMYADKWVLGPNGTPSVTYSFLGLALMRGDWLPAVDNTYSMGNATVSWKEVVTNELIVKASAEITGNIKISGQMSLGGGLAFSSANITTISKSFTTGGDAVSRYGIYLTHGSTPGSQQWGGSIGIGGYAIIGSTNKVGETYGLAFGPYCDIGATCGVTSTQTINSTAVYTRTFGIETWGARGYSGTFKAQEIYGLRVKGCKNDGAMTAFNATSCYTVQIQNSDTLGGSGSIGKLYGLHIEAMSRGTTNRQLALDGYQSASDGIWLNENGTSLHLFASSTGDFHVQNLGTTTGSYMLYNTTTKEVGYQSSSRRYKDDIRRLTEDWTKILDVEVKEYTRKECGTKEIGLIAEELVDAGLDKLVGYKDGLPEYIDYPKVSLYLLEIVKQQQGQINELKERIDGLERKKD